MTRAADKLCAGDWVVVRNEREIADTLDVNGALDGLPFMPEMTRLCGRCIRVLRVAEKTCVEYPGMEYKIREFRNNDVVILEASRCSGADHDGCGRACVFLWKMAWLRKVSTNTDTAAVDQPAQEALRATLKTTTAPDHYFCQSTELAKATPPLSRNQVIMKCFKEVLSGNRGVFEMVRMVLVPVWRYATERFHAPIRVGDLKRTPVGNLNLQPSELVRIKTEAEIVKTLDSRALNRGLSCDRGMRQFCGGTYKVRNRLNRMISESSGRMRQVEGTVILEGLQCICWWNHVGGCPREDYMYWREVWLERAGGNGDPSRGTPNTEETKSSVS